MILHCHVFHILISSFRVLQLPITVHTYYVAKWGIQSRPPYREVFLFENHPHKDVSVLILPTVGCFCLSVTCRESLCLSVTHRKLLLFQGHQQKKLKVTEAPIERCS